MPTRKPKPISASKKPEAQKKRRGGTRPIGDLVRRLTRPALGRHGFSSGVLIAEWPSVVGSELARGCQPIKLTFAPGKRSDGTLHVRVSGGTALQLQHVEPQIIERINGFLGYAGVDRLKLIQAPVAADCRSERSTDETPAPKAPAVAESAPAEPLSPPLSSIEDPHLRASLERLGAAIRENESKSKKGR